jgi:hypothetical protein
MAVVVQADPRSVHEHRLARLDVRHLQRLVLDDVPVHVLDGLASPALTALASSGRQYCTKAKPLHFPVIGSRWMSISSISPNGSNS